MTINYATAPVSAEGLGHNAHLPLADQLRIGVTLADQPVTGAEMTDRKRFQYIVSRLYSCLVEGELCDPYVLTLTDTPTIDLADEDLLDLPRMETVNPAYNIQHRFHAPIHQLMQEATDAEGPIAERADRMVTGICQYIADNCILRAVWYADEDEDEQDRQTGPDVAKLLPEAYAGTPPPIMKPAR